MKSNDFLSNILQIIGFLAAIILAISQYFFSGNFKFLFQGNEQIYYLANIVALVLSLAIITGLYSNRFSIELKNYFNRTKRDLYWKKLGVANQKDVEVVSEPWYWTISQLSFWLLLLALCSFLGLLFFTDYSLRAFFYVLFVCFSIASLSIFSLRIYLLHEFRNNEDRIRRRTIEKMNEYFVGNLKISGEGVDRKTPQYPLRTFHVEYEGQKYIFNADANDPDQFFQVQLVAGNNNG